MLELVGEPGGAGVGELADDDAFADLYRQQLRPMVRFAHLLTGGSPAAEELVQEAFVAVHRRWATVEHPVAYLRRAVVNGAASHRRRLRLEERHAAAAPEAIEQPNDELRDAIAALPPRQRAAVVLRYYEDLPEAEIAAVMGCRVPAVKSLLHRALGQLREAVEP